jgi:hypothetical protein
MENKPFALIGVNTNGYTVQKLKEVMDKEKLNWRSFAEKRDGDDGMGKITGTFNLQGTPTLFLLDHKGVIRNRWLGSPGEAKIDEAIHALIKEADNEGKK